MCAFLTGVDELSLRVLQNLQGFHVVIEVLKHSSSFTQDAVSREQCLLLLQQQGHVVIGVARREQHSGKKINFKQALTVAEQNLMFFPQAHMKRTELT